MRVQSWRLLHAAISQHPQAHPPLLMQVLKGCKRLAMSVCSMGRIPGGYITNHVYSWVDPQGRSVSPPPDSQEVNPRQGPSMEERTVRTTCVLCVLWWKRKETKMNNGFQVDSFPLKRKISLQDCEMTSVRSIIHDDNKGFVIVLPLIFLTAVNSGLDYGSLTQSSWPLMVWNIGRQTHTTTKSTTSGLWLWLLIKRFSHIESSGK